MEPGCKLEDFGRLVQPAATNRLRCRVNDSIWAIFGEHMNLREKTALLLYFWPVHGETVMFWFFWDRGSKFHRLVFSILYVCRYVVIVRIKNSLFIQFGSFCCIFGRLWCWLLFWFGLVFEACRLAGAQAFPPSLRRRKLGRWLVIWQSMLNCQGCASSGDCKTIHNNDLQP